MKKAISTFQFITQEHETLSHVEQTKLVCKAGGKWIQYRDKVLGANEKLQVAKELRGITNQYGAKLIINDDVSLAKMVRADGVHLGQDDMSAQRARMIIGKKVIIGKTCNTLEQINEINDSHVDYIGLGPFRHTRTKAVLSPVLGLEGYSTILKAKNNAIPIVGIGGITQEDVSSLLTTGLHGIAVSGSVLDNDVCDNVTRFLTSLEMTVK